MAMTPTPWHRLTLAALERCTGEEAQFTHECVEIPMGDLDALPLGVVRTGQREGGFQLSPMNMGAIRRMRTAMASFGDAGKRPGARIAAEAASLLVSLGGLEMPAKIAERALLFARLALGDVWTLVFRLQADRGGGAYELAPIACPRCGQTFAPRLDLTRRPVRCYRGPGGALLAPDEQPQAVVRLRFPIQFQLAGGRTSTTLVLGIPTWMQTFYEAPASDWKGEGEAVFERTVAAAILGDQDGPFPGPLGLPSIGDMHGLDYDRLKAVALVLAGGPPAIVNVECPNSAGRCEAKLGFPVSWDNADFFSVA